jgi:hypothetical protein
VSLLTDSEGKALEREVARLFEFALTPPEGRRKQKARRLRSRPRPAEGNEILKPRIDYVPLIGNDSPCELCDRRAIIVRLGSARCDWNVTEGLSGDGLRMARSRRW